MRLALFLLASPLMAQVAGLSSVWNVTNRAGDYSNSETACYLPSNVSVSGGYLNLVTQAGPYTCGDSVHPPTSHPYTSGRVIWSSYNFRYGTLEVRAKLAGAHTWPAIWLLGANCQPGDPDTSENQGTCDWPNAGGSEEIDVAEYLTQQGRFINNVFANGNTSGAACDISPAINPSSGFHTYKMVWTSTSLQFYMDGVSTGCSYSGSNVPQSFMYLILGTATGGQGGTPSGLPTTFQVDWVKVTAPDGSTVTQFDDFLTALPRATKPAGGIFSGKVIR